ncbi:hypothetical protein DFQ27_008390 [Actinomortierella ambigua]|uniref:Protein-lysine N-methyltransferase EFM6 n=1 Tax=Actinomortierella ambigua TaxID=1343610 RepID=A0A9P6QG76_9FUNG|nr:hypothetical protein DFQ27_008390 [Actinomortierella ambigua]
MGQRGQKDGSDSSDFSGDSDSEEYTMKRFLKLNSSSSTTPSAAPPTTVSAHNTLAPLVALHLPVTKDQQVYSYPGAPGVSIELMQDSRGGCGGKIWEAGDFLCRYLIHMKQQAKLQEEELGGGGHDLPMSSLTPRFPQLDYCEATKKDTTKQNKSPLILELGSGTGLVGLYAAKLFPGATVHITDQIPMMPIMEANLQLNGLQQSTKALELNWGEPKPEDAPIPDVILLADCVYHEVAFQPLVQTLKDYSTRETCILLAYKKRRKADKRFFTLLRKHFDCVEIKTYPDYTIYSRAGVYLYDIKRKASK